MDTLFADRVSKVTLDLYNSLPKKGKPVAGKEWTTLSSIVMSLDEQLTVVAMATGTKCLGQSQMSPRGDLVNDSHAEVLCRRCFLRYLYDQINKFKNTGSSEIIISCDKNRYKVNPNIQFHFFTSHVPCGDASIITKTISNVKRKSELEDELLVKRQKVDAQVIGEENDSEFSIENGIGDSDSTKDVDWEMEVGQDVHRTGAKCVAGTDPKLAGIAYHTVGAVRTKPGRGDPTLSVSCSDKMARWIACGLQGALLSLLLCPVVLHTVVVGGGGPYSREVLERALLTRTGTTHRPTLLRSSLVFPESRYCVSDSAKPCPSAILWVKVSQKPLEVCVEGRRQGATKKCRDNGRLMVCRLELLRNFLSITWDRFSKMTYSDIKATSEEYQSAWLRSKKNLGVWTTKPKHLQDFVLH
ncbi:tRNA-specific adenosine deaminase 1 [Macrosteles quadrilineatus]|uniref:tRNA-specific adenosine deaminase 1 n=1 Tax=Macrosteles quadrilineatus TaxID=74068 RepID=UPI0023E19CED|nr:tRNA-specific adenosine deaminase 1 [Macrosteles quadrilineatus]